MQWDTVDYVAAFMLFTMALAAYYLVATRVKTKKNRIIGAFMVFGVFLLIWAELAVGIFR